MSIKNLTTFTPLATPGVERILCRLSACRCGCNGRDSWHKPFIKRKVRNVRLADVSLADAPSGEVVVAYGEAKLPWGVEPVQATVYKFSDGRLGRLADWSLVDLRR